MAKRTFSDAMISRSKYGRRVRAKLTKKLPMSAIPRSLVPETKFRDFSINSISAFLSLSIVIPQGIGRDQRTGNRIFLKSVDVTYQDGTISTPAPYPTTSRRMSFLITKDPSIAPVFLTPHNRYNQDDFYILKDSVSSSTVSTASRLIVPLNLSQTYNNAGFILSNHLYVVNNVQGGWDQASNMTARVYYTDA